MFKSVELKCLKVQQKSSFFLGKNRVCLKIAADTRSQGYTNLQSLINCLDHAQYAVKQGCIRQRDALTCIGMHLKGHIYSNVKSADTESC